MGSLSELSNLARMVIAFFVLSIFLGIALSISDSVYAFTFFGGMLGISSAMLVVWKIYTNPNAKASPSLELLFWRALCDLGIGIRFILFPLWNLYICGSTTCNIIADISDQSQCALPAAVLEFFELASEAWFFCLAIDLAISITNPFSSFRERLPQYHGFSWVSALAMGLIIGLVKSLSGYWYITTNVNDSVFCWIKFHHSNQLNWKPFAMFYIPLLLVYATAIASLVISYQRLKTGISATFQHRVRVLVLNSINIAIYLLYWSYILGLYAILSFSPNSVVYNLLMFSISSKGFADLFVLILVSDTINVLDGHENKTTDEAKKLDLNAALRSEVLYFATTGIRKSANRGITLLEHVPKSVMSMEQASSTGNSAPHAFSIMFFLRLAFGFNSQISSVYAMTSKNAKHEQEKSKAPTRLSKLDQLSVHKADSSGDRPLPPFGISSGKEPDFEIRPTDVYVNDLTDITREEDDDDVECDTRYNKRTWLERLQSFVRGADMMVTFTEYEPYYFRQVRLCSGVDDEKYMNSFRTTIKERMTEGGASGAFFFFSAGETFIAKSCTEAEMEVLKNNAKAYSTYMSNNLNSYITKILGAYKLHIYGTDLFFFVMNNIFLSEKDDVINEKYDLKGSWVARNATPPQDGQRVTCTHCNQKFVYVKGNKKKRPVGGKPRQSSVTSVESTKLEEGLAMDIEDRCPVMVTGRHEPTVILKDNDLKYKIRLPNHDAKVLLAQLKSDAEFLLSVDVMDYSLLVGVHNTEYFVEETLADVSCDENTPLNAPLKKLVSSRGGDSEGSINPMVVDTPRPVSAVSLYSRRHQVSRVVGPDAYYMGIVDFQQEWNFSKKMERMMKIHLKGADPKGLSCIEPVTYRNRFIRRMEELLEIEDDDRSGSVDCSAY